MNPAIYQPPTGTSGELAPGIAVKKSPIDGLGCFADVCFPAGSVIAEYRGERISNLEAARRMQQTDKPQISQLDDQWSIDGSVGGNGTHYLNHSCDPNATVDIIDDRILLFASRDIFPGEEITTAYLNSYESDRSVCNCQSINCRNLEKAQHASF